MKFNTWGYVFTKDYSDFIESFWDKKSGFFHLKNIDKPFSFENIISVHDDYIYIEFGHVDLLDAFHFMNQVEIDNMVFKTRDDDGEDYVYIGIVENGIRSSAELGGRFDLLSAEKLYEGKLLDKIKEKSEISDCPIFYDEDSQLKFHNSEKYKNFIDENTKVIVLEDVIFDDE